MGQKPDIEKDKRNQPTAKHCGTGKTYRIRQLATTKRITPREASNSCRQRVGQSQGRSRAPTSRGYLVGAGRGDRWASQGKAKAEPGQSQGRTRRQSQDRARTEPEGRARAEPGQRAPADQLEPAEDTEGPRPRSQKNGRQRPNQTRNRQRPTNRGQRGAKDAPGEKPRGVGYT